MGVAAAYLQNREWPSLLGVCLSTMTASTDDRTTPMQYDPAHNTYFTASMSPAMSKESLTALLASERPVEANGKLFLLGTIGPDSMERVVVLCLSDTPSIVDAGSEDAERQEASLKWLRKVDGLDSASVAMMEFKQRRGRR